jgi:hypothetical protein
VTYTVNVIGTDVFAENDGTTKDILYELLYITGKLV